MKNKIKLNIQRFSYTPYEPINFENGTLKTPGSVNLATGEITIGDTARTTAITSVNENTAPENVLSWTDLGMSGKPASVATAKYNVATGKLTCTSTNTKLATAEN